MIRRNVRPAGAVVPGPGAGTTSNGGAMSGLHGAGDAKSWSPTVANLLVLVVLEMVAFSVIRYVFKRLSD